MAATIGIVIDFTKNFVEVEMWDVIKIVVEAIAIKVSSSYIIEVVVATIIQNFPICSIIKAITKTLAKIN